MEESKPVGLNRMVKIG